METIDWNDLTKHFSHSDRMIIEREKSGLIIDLARAAQQYPDRPITREEYEAHLQDVLDHRKFHNQQFNLAVQDVEDLLANLGDAQVACFDQLSDEEQVRAMYRRALVFNACRLLKNQIIKGKGCMTHPHHLCVCHECGRVCLGRIDEKTGSLIIPWHRIGHIRCPGSGQFASKDVPEGEKAGMKVDLETGELE